MQIAPRVRIVACRRRSAVQPAAPGAVVGSPVRRAVQPASRRHVDADGRTAGLVPKTQGAEVGSHGHFSYALYALYMPYMP